MRCHVLLLATAIVALSACGSTDVKGNSCDYYALLYDDDGNQYCPDEGAKDDCTSLNDAIVAAAVACANGAITEEELRAELAENRSLQTCDDAVATSTDYDACVAYFGEDGGEGVDPRCSGIGLAPAPDVCVGAVLTAPAA